MTDEVQTQEQDDAAFNAGFSEARGDEPPTEEVKVEEPAAEDVAPEPVAEEPPAPEVVFAGLTEDQLKAALAKASEVDDLKGQVRQLFGRLGEYNAKLQQVSQTAGQPTKITGDQLKRLHENWGELANDLAEDLSGLTLGSNAAPFDPTELRSELEQKFSDELDKIKKDSELKMLKMRHKDWETIRSSDDFALWEQTLPPDERQTLAESWDAMYVADQFDRFKDWRSNAQSAKQQKQQRLEAAITPKGAPAPAPNSINDDDAFFAGFKQVRRG